MANPLNLEERQELLTHMAQYWGHHGAPSSICTFGSPGVGKTLDNGMSFHRLAIYIGIKSHLTSIPAATGIPMGELAVMDVRTISQVVSVMHEVSRWNLERIRAGEMPWIAMVIDDLQYLATGQFQAREQEMIQARAAEGKDPDSRGVYLSVTKDIGYMMNLVRDLSLHLIINSHARDRDETLPRGTPMLPSRNMGQTFSGQIGTLLYAEKEVTTTVQAFAMPGGAAPEEPSKPFGWPGRYCAHHPSYICRDRLGAAPERGPMNLRELLISAGHSVPRAPEMEWLDPAVESGAEALLAGADYWSELRPKLLKFAADNGHKAGSAGSNWLLRDTIDRYRMREAIATPTFY